MSSGTGNSGWQHPREGDPRERHPGVVISEQITATVEATPDESSFPRLVQIWDIIRSECAEQTFGFDDLKTLGIRPDEASHALRHLKGKGRIVTVGPQQFRIRSMNALV